MVFHTLIIPNCAPNKSAYIYLICVSLIIYTQFTTNKKKGTGVSPDKYMKYP